MSPYASGTRRGKIAMERFSSELNAAKATILINVAFRKKRALYPTKWVATKRPPDEGKRNKMLWEGKEEAGLRRASLVHEQHQDHAMGRLHPEAQDDAGIGELPGAQEDHIRCAGPVTRGRRRTRKPPRTWTRVATAGASGTAFSGGRRSSGRRGDLYWNIGQVRQEHVLRRVPAGVEVSLEADRIRSWTSGTSYTRQEVRLARRRLHSIGRPGPRRSGPRRATGRAWLRLETTPTRSGSSFRCTFLAQAGEHRSSSKRRTRSR